MADLEDRFQIQYYFSKYRRQSDINRLKLHQGKFYWEQLKRMEVKEEERMGEFGINIYTLVYINR